MGAAGANISGGRVQRAADLTTFVTVGNASQSFARLLEGVRQIASRLPQPVIVQHGHTPFQDGICRSMPFLGADEFMRHVHDADLLIMHAGAGSMIHAMEVGKVPVVMPRRATFGEHVNDHQAELAQALADTGRVVLADKSEDLMQAVEAALVRQKNTQDNHVAGRNPPPLVSVIGRILDEYAVRNFSKHR